MNSILLTEETGIINNYSGDVRPGCLGRMYGPVADLKEGTRNGRVYSRKLWERVFNVPWVKEALETKTLFGEADHPAERLETSLKEVAVVLTEFNFNDSEGVLEGAFDILDTPNGRILKSLVDYGCKLGVSSRGRGRIIESQGQQVVDENSYVFGGFDVVVLPAVKKARQDYINESASTTVLNVSESIRKQINESRSVDDLSTIKRLIESAKSSDLMPLVEMIDQKVRSFNSVDSDTITKSKLVQELTESRKTIIELESKLSESVNTIDINESMVDLKFMQSLVNESADLNNLVLSLRTQLSTKISELTNVRESMNAIKRDLLQSKLVNSSLTNGGTVRPDGGLKEKLQLSNSARNTLNEKLESFERESAELKESLEDGRVMISDLKERLNETNSYVSELETSNEAFSNYSDELLKENNKLFNSYIRVVSEKSGISADRIVRSLPKNPTIEDVDNAVNESVSLKRRVNKLPFSLGGNEVGAKIVESDETKSDSALVGTRMMLEGFRKSSTASNKQ